MFGLKCLEGIYIYTVHMYIPNIGYRLRYMMKKNTVSTSRHKGCERQTPGAKHTQACVKFDLTNKYSI
jgi:hypothetical protein